MPGNTVKINKLDDYEWYVGDSKIDQLIEWLNEHGSRSESNVIGFEARPSKSQLLGQWIDELIYPGKAEDFVQNLGVDEPADGEVESSIRLYTEEHQYGITAIDRPDDDGYLSCSVTARKARAGEDWTRGNDLPDGPFNRETWERILNAMINYELIQLTTFTKPSTIPEEAA
jgi:hypothetical protein